MPSPSVTFPASLLSRRLAIARTPNQSRRLSLNLLRAQKVHHRRPPLPSNTMRGKPNMKLTLLNGVGSRPRPVSARRRNEPDGKKCVRGRERKRD